MSRVSVKVEKERAVDMIMQAAVAVVNAENNRCADIAMSVTHPKPASDAYVMGFTAAQFMIAEAIRGNDA